MVLRSFATHFNLGFVSGTELLVRLPTIRRRRIPDILFVAAHRAAILGPHEVEGAPDLVVEIASPDSEERDWDDKYKEYAAAGVLEYWLFDLISSRVAGFALDADRQHRSIPVVDGRLHSTVLPGFFLRPSWLMQDPLPHPSPVLAELGVPR
jgi:Uma2 family endonuclease